MRHETDAAKSVPEMLLRRVEATPDAAAFLHPEGDGWKTLTWQQTGDRVRAIACGLLSLGLLPEERCAILSSTRIDWILADLGILCAGGATTTIYPANTVDECVYILQDCEAAFVFAEDAAWLEKLARCRGDIPSVKNVIVFDGPGSEDGWAIPLAGLESRGRAHDAAHPEAYEAAIRGSEPSSLATLIYTSGTTGQPKGVELTHDCWVYEAEAIDALGMIGPDDLQYFWLPLAHVFGKVLEAAQIRIGFPTAVDGRVDKLVENLKVIRPTFICAVPRIFEKVYNRFSARRRQRAASSTRSSSGRSVSAGESRSSARPGKARGPPRRSSRLADALVSEEGARNVRRAAALLHLGKRAALEGPGRVLPRVRRPGPRGLRPHRVERGDVRQPAARRRSSGPLGPPCPGPRSRSRRTARSSFGGAASCVATTTGPRPRPRRSTKTAGSTPATSASSTQRAS